MKTFQTISVFLFVFMSWLSMPVPAFADRLEVLPTDHDFGDVEVGTTVTTIISLTNINGSDVTVTGVGFQAGGSADFSLANSSPVPFIVVPGDTVEIEVAFSPSAAGYVTAVLEIESTDQIEPLQMVFLGGVGVDTQPPPLTIHDILSFFDQSVEAGTLSGVGHYPWVKRARLRAFRGMLVVAGKFMAQGRIKLACRVLKHAYERSDGMVWPFDYVEGDARAQLNGMIGQLGADLGCR